MTIAYKVGIIGIRGDVVMAFTKKVMIIINPCSGTKRANKYLTDILLLFAENGYETAVFITLQAGDAERYAAINAHKFDLLVAIGGDGTFNEAVSGVIRSETDIPIGYIPAGSTNDFANGLKLSKNIMQAAKNILNGNQRIIDVGMFNGRYFSYVASFGAFTKVSYSTPQNIKNAFGHLAYVLEGIKDIPSIRDCHLKFVADGKTIEGDYIFGAVCNSTSVGGILTLDPKVVDLNDGLFELLLVKTPNDVIELNQIIISLNTQRYDNDMITFVSAKNIIVEGSADYDWTLDGEFAKGCDKIQISNIHNAIRFIS